MTKSLLATCFQAVVDIRNYCYDHKLLPSYSVNIPVVCVGNALVGGSGKTPFVQYLVNKFRDRGLRPAILMRGYKGNVPQPHCVTSQDTFQEVGDEAMLHHTYFAGNVPVIVSKDRYRGALYIEQNNLADIIVMDDGMQHRRLNRTFNYLLFKRSVFSATSSTSLQMLPLGRLREPLHAAISRAQAIVIIETDSSPQPLPQALADCQLSEVTMPQETTPDVIRPPVIRMYQRPSGFRDLYTRKFYSVDTFVAANPSARFALVSALADNLGFHDTIKSLGISPASTHAFADHYPYSKQDIDLLLAHDQSDVSSYGDPNRHILLTTSKDAVKLAHLIPAADRCFALEIELDCIGPGDIAVDLVISKAP